MCQVDSSDRRRYRKCWRMEKNMTEISVVQRVSDVPIAKSALPEKSSMRALEGLSQLKFEACSNHGSSLVGTLYHPFVSAATVAFAHHRPLVLSPDMFWLLVTQGLALHVQANAEALREKFVLHDGKETITVRRDDFVKGDASNPWSEVFGEFSAQIKTMIGEENHANIVASFSTTSQIERAANEIVLMQTLQPYFDYSVSTLCGIPSVSLEGTANDWGSLRQRVASLGRAYNLTWWTDRMAPSLERMADNAAGEDDAELWRDFYKYDGMSGGPYISGWIADFFPYVTTAVLVDKQGNELDRPTLSEGIFAPVEMSTARKLTTNHFFSGEDVMGITTGSLPGSLSSVPFKWRYLKQEFDMAFVAGFIGILQDKQDMSVRPVIGWGVGESSC